LPYKETKRSPVRANVNPESSRVTGSPGWMWYAFLPAIIWTDPSCMLKWWKYVVSWIVTMPMLGPRTRNCAVVLGCIFVDMISFLMSNDIRGLFLAMHTRQLGMFLRCEDVSGQRNALPAH